MEDKNPSINQNKLTADQRDKLEKWQHDVKSLRTLEDIATMAQEMLGIMDDQQKDPGRKTLIIDHVTGDDFVKILKNMQEAILAFKEQKEPVLPDYSKPVVGAISKLETALKAAMKATDTKPVINVAAPNVQVEPTPIDFRGLEKLLKEIPKAFEEAVKSIPQPDIPETDNQPLLDAWEGISEQLQSIENATRAKPMPGSMAISNLTDETLPVSQMAAKLTGPLALQVDAAGNGNGSVLTITGFNTAMLHVLSSTAMSGGTTINFEASVDGVTWTAVMATLISSGAVASTATTDGDYRVNVNGFNKLRARVSAYSAGKTTITGYLSPLAGQSASVILGTGSSVIAVGNVASAATDSGNPVKTGGKYNSSNITLTDGQRGDTQVDVNSFERVTLATQLSGEDQTNGVFKVEGQFSYVNMTTAATTTAKSGAGLLHGITVNTPVASATVTIYDNTAGSGATIGKITLGGTLASDQTSTYLYDVKFTTGLTVVTSGATDITISYR